MNTDKFVEIMSKVTEVDKKWWILGVFGAIIIFNMIGYGG